MWSKVLIVLVLCIGCFFAGLIVGPAPVEKDIQSPIEACNSLIKSSAVGMTDPYLGIIFIRTVGATPEQVQNVMLHEWAHYLKYYYDGDAYDENYSTTYAATHYICGGN